MKVKTKRYFVKDDGIFPNNSLPILFYPKVLDLPKLFPALSIRKLFRKNNWTNNWKQGIYTYHHYHSTTHEVLGVCKGETLLQLGSKNHHQPFPVGQYQLNYQVGKRFKLAVYFYVRILLTNLICKICRHKFLFGEEKLLRNAQLLESALQVTGLIFLFHGPCLIWT